jgi:sec-independent protein translocase protein TatA
MFGLGMGEMIIVGVVAILLFGKNLPSVAKSLGYSYREFKKGLSDITSSVDIMSDTSYTPPKSSRSARRYDDYDDREEATAPKFEPPPSEPQPSEPQPGSTSQPA